MAKAVPTKTDTGCRPSQWFGEWAILPDALTSNLAIVQQADLQAVSAASAAMAPPPPYTVAADGLATINLTGPMAKYGSSVQSLIGGSSSLEKRAALRAAVRDPEVKAIMLKIDSPGGTVSGTGDLAAAVAAADQRKPTYAFIEDLGASAAYRVASRARRIYANADAQVGSIGTYAVLTDTSGRAEKEGVKVHIVKSGAFKAVGEPGSAVTEEQLDETQRRVTALNEQFLADVSTGRKLPMEAVRALADGRVHMAAAAKQLGLIDSVASLEQATQEIGRALMEENANALAEARAEAAEAQLAVVREELAKVTAEAAAAAAKVKAIEDRETLATMQASLAALKNLPAQAALAQALVDIRAKAPEAFDTLEKQIRAWDAQVTVSALFEERGTSEAGAQTVNTKNAQEFRAAADALVAAKKAPNRAAAMEAILREQAQGGK